MSKPKPGTPLPAALNGVLVERIIRVDSALLYLVTGALEFLLDKEKLEQTGTLTVDEAKNAILEMFYIYLDESETAMPVGAMMLWGSEIIPARWLKCSGQSAFIADYPELFDVIGTTYGAAGETGFFLPDFRGRSPMGSGDFGIDLGTETGDQEVTLTTLQMPAHTHNITRYNGTVAGTNLMSQWQVAVNPPHATPGVTQSAGGGLPHNNRHPVLGVYMIIYAGRLPP